MRYLLLGLLVGTCLLPIDGSAQTADFKCPKPGTVVNFGNGQQQTWLRLDETGMYCRVKTEGEPTRDGPMRAWYAPGVLLGAWPSGLNPFAVQTNVHSIWPLSVGKSISGRFDGAASRGARQLSVVMSLKVEKYERITTKAGPFDTFVVLLQAEAMSDTLDRWSIREWYAADPGVVVRRQHRNKNNTTSWDTEATSISTP